MDTIFKKKQTAKVALIFFFLIFPLFFLFTVSYAKEKVHISKSLSVYEILPHLGSVIPLSLFSPLV